MKVTSLSYYPIKSCGGVSAPFLDLETAGPAYDRAWMIVEEATGKFVTQRQAPQLQLVKPRVISGQLVLPTVDLGTGGFLREVEVWGDRLAAEDEGDAAAAYFSQICGLPVRLVRQGAARRITGKPGEEREVRFADAFPLHLCTEESLADFNRQAGTQLEMERFRANVVLSGAEAPWSEDHWAGIEIGGQRFPRTRATTRCAITSVDPVTTEKGPEPLRTLARIRRGPKGVEFGQYFLSLAGARLELGMEAKPF